MQTEQLTELRSFWEEDQEVIVEKTFYSDNDQAMKLLVILKNNTNDYNCHRYFPIAKNWQISVDKKNNSAENAMKWLAENITT